MTPGAGLRPTHWRAPAKHGQALVEPPPAELPLAPPAELLPAQAAARAELLAAAAQYTAAYRDLPPLPAAPATILLSGHQPQWFHPGVWFKNALLSELARQRSAAAVNLIIDNDAVGPVAIAAPAGSLAAPRLESIPLDAPSSELPWEERGVQDAATFARFPQAVAQTYGPLLREAGIDEPLVLDRLWPEAQRALAAGDRLGLILARARHAVEAAWGLATLELPLSRVCQTESFRRFLLRLVEEAPRLRSLYNGALAEYRQVYRLRSRSHPVPDLAEEGGWQEAPLWTWSRERPQRRRLFVRSLPDRRLLTDRAGWQTEMALGADAALEQLADWERQGIKLRPRALATTMYARLVLGDVFIHGIGGAKYDEVTNLLLARFWGVPPPPFITATATIALPLPRPAITDADVLRCRQAQRDVRFHGETLRERLTQRGATPEELAEFDAAAEEKRQWLTRIPAHRPRKTWQQRMAAINGRLAERLASETARLRAEETRLAEEARRNRLLGSREFSLCLFPEGNLRRLLLDLARAAT